MVDAWYEADYMVIRTVDLADDEEFLVVPRPSSAELEALSDDTPNWDDSPNSWCLEDFLNPAIYKSAEVIYVKL